MYLIPLVIKKSVIVSEANTEAVDQNVEPEEEFEKDENAGTLVEKIFYQDTPVEQLAVANELSRSSASGRKSMGRKSGALLDSDTNTSMKDKSVHFIVSF